ncbi:Rieske (2Fe-2S) protein [filamentous cyanobacterium LEGE 11480]|uniref:Rieske (2Fe-2S) protein n=1 Tax=Romeriopsis navalis LEGE 11480 TaxID=2777977 RepID=A0A928VLI5_9CYAN|nr:Rieske (2Fe-2S) protein [Romeriopsis navalis]MBE9028735.1 Rieske (2Fe-2S) protein [Romeriopsis navalis LEGE 11480]
MDRRLFIKLAGVSTIATSLPATLTACNGAKSNESSNALEAKAPPTSQAPARSDGFTDIGSVADLAESGSLRYQDAKGNGILVVQQSDTPEDVQAFSSVCTHQGCNVSWKAKDKDIFCACHGSRFATDGKVTEGPAETPLQQYLTKVEDNRILIKMV